VKNVRASILWFLPLVAALVCADEAIKFFALGHFPDEHSLVDPGSFALAIHKNWGIAFDIPFKMHLIVIVSAIIGIALLWVAYKNFRQKPTVAFSAVMIVLGAIGNMYDRVAYGFTVDYLILFGRSAINISDVVIVAGVVTLLYASRVRGLHQHGHGAFEDETEEEDTIDKKASA